MRYLLGKSVENVAFYLIEIYSDVGYEVYRIEIEVGDYGKVSGK